MTNPIGPYQPYEKGILIFQNYLLIWKQLCGDIKDFIQVIVYKKHCLVESCPVNIYLFQVNNGNIRKRCEICSKLAIYTLEQCQPCPLESSEIITFFSVSTVDFEQVNICWVD